MIPLATSELAEAFGRDVSPTHCLRTLLWEGVQENPQGAAVVSLYQPEGHLSQLTLQGTKNLGHLSWTYSELQHAASRLATVLHGNGARKGSVVATFLPNSIEWSLFFWATAGLGASLVPLNPRSISRPAELRHILRSLGITVLIVQDTDAATSFETHANEAAQAITLRVVCNIGGSGCPNGWCSLVDLCDDTPLAIDWRSSNTANSAQEAAVILFSSGTTSSPKACAHSATNLDSQTASYSTTRLLDSKSKTLVHSPNFHIAAVWNLLCNWRAGATVIFPSQRFDAGATLKGIKSQECTHLGCTPSMLYAMFGHPLFPSHVPTSLKLLLIGAEMVTPGLITRCQNEIGPQVVVRSNWGMTEGIGLTAPSKNDIVTFRNGVVAVGKVMPGSRIRICQVGNRTPVKRGNVGEIHCSGTSVVNGYLNRSNDEAFYTDEHGTWFISGDSAIMDESGSLYILGRYKDIIIRGGENISPTMIEYCLNRWGGIETHVIGIPDSIIGEVPVAVVKNLSGHIHTSKWKSELQELVSRELGTAFALGAVFSLEELGVNDFPLTASGKVRKDDLRAQIDEHMRKMDQRIDQQRQNSILDQIISTWSHVLGYSADKIYSSMSAFDVADSLTIMRFCYEVEKSCGRQISLSDIQDNETPQKQALLLESRKNSTEADTLLSFPTRLGPPSGKELAHVFGNLSTTDEAAEFCRPALEAVNLQWQNDVEDVYCNNDMVRDFWSSQQRVASSNIRWALQTTASDPSQLRKALEAVLTRHSTFRSIYVKSQKNLPIHIIIRPSQHWFDQCISDLGHVSTTDDLLALLSNMSLKFGTDPGPLFQAAMMYVESTGRMGLVMSIHHSTYDAFSMWSFFQEVDDILANCTSSLSGVIPFKLYADMYHLHKEGSAALDAVRYCVSRLQGISNYNKAFWPTQKAPEWLIGDYTGWTHRNGEPGKPEERKPVDREENGLKSPAYARIQNRNTFPYLKQLKQHHSIEASTAVKAAVALCNSEMTGQDHAVFCNLDSARKWPFMEEWITDRLPNPINIAGPTMGCSINVISVDTQCETLAFMTRIGEEQIEQSRHINAPFSAIMEQLGDREGNIIHDLARRQVLNWDPAMRQRLAGGYKCLKQLDRQSWLDLGVFWNFGLIDDESLVGAITYDNAQLGHEEASGALARVLEIVHWITKPENWGRPIGEGVKASEVERE